MKKLKIISVAVLILTLVITSLAGCGGKTQEQTKDTAASTSSQTASAASSEEDSLKDPVEISVGSWDTEAALANKDTDAIYQTIAKKLNITLKAVNTTWDDYSQKIQLWAASNQLPDIFSIDAVGTQYGRNWTSQGIVKALPDDLSKYPSLNEYLQTPDIQGLKENGKLYTVPRKTYPTLDWNAMDRTVLYRWDLAQQAGITKQPETWDEFRAMLKAIVSKDPEKKKIAGFISSSTKILDGFFCTYSIPAATSDGSGADYKWIKEDGKFVPAVFSKNAIDSFKLARDMWTEGIIDKDIALVKGDEAYDKFASGKDAALLCTGIGNFDSKIVKQRWSKVYPDKNVNESVKILNPLLGKDGTRYHAVFKTYWSESYFSSKVDDKKMDRIMRLYDYLVSPEGMELLRFGIKDVDYKKDGDKITVTDPKVNLAEKYKFLSAFGYLAQWDSEYTYTLGTALTPEDLKMSNDFMNYVKSNTKVPDFDIRLTYMSTPAKDKFTVPIADDMLTIMLGKEPVDKMWADLLKNYEAKGMSKVIDEVNAKAKEQGIN